MTTAGEQTHGNPTGPASAHARPPRGSKAAGRRSRLATSVGRPLLAIDATWAAGSLAHLLHAPSWWFLVGGVYGVLAGSVSERTKEIGVRTALGATTIDTYALVLRRGLGMAAVGLLLGLVGAVATTRYLQALLFGVAPTDPTVLLVSAVLLFAVAFIACLIPARRAVHIEPMVALRQ